MTRRSMWTRQAKRNNEFMHNLADFFAEKSNGLVFTEDVVLSARYYRSGGQRPDIDNLVKMTMDALQKSGVIKNDRQVVQLVAAVSYGNDNPRQEIEIWPSE